MARTDNTRTKKGRYNVTHGDYGSPTHQIWHGMRTRCNNPNASSYPRYGGRGIKVCERWNSYENFRADMGERPAGLTLDRIDNNGDYTPENCRWATVSQQSRNRSTSRQITFDGRTMSLADWCDLLGVPFLQVYKRIQKGKTFVEAVTTQGKPGFTGYLHGVTRRGR